MDRPAVGWLHGRRKAILRPLFLLHFFDFKSTTTSSGNWKLSESEGVNINKSSIFFFSGNHPPIARLSRPTAPRSQQYESWRGPLLTCRIGTGGIRWEAGGPCHTWFVSRPHVGFGQNPREPTFWFDINGLCFKCAVTPIAKLQRKKLMSKISTTNLMRLLRQIS